MIKNILNSVFEKYKNAILFNTLTDTKFTMGRYMKLAINGDYRALKKYPLPISKSVFQPLYATIMEEYTKLSGNDEVIAEKERQEAYVALCKRQNVLVWAATVLSVDPESQNTLAFLKKHRIKPEGLANEISVLNIRIDEQKASFEKKVTKGENKASKQDFYRMFALLEKSGYGEITEKTPILKFIKANELFRKEVEANNKQMEKLKNR